MESNENYYRSDIDGLRAFAILSVIGFHYFYEWFPGGFIGVDIFFVISGFLITTILLRGLDNNEYSLAKFYSKRILRIFPSLIIVVASVLILGWFLLLPEELALLGKHIQRSITFSQNFNLMNEAGYFDPSSDQKPLLHLWSLSIEEQFYLFWPLLLSGLTSIKIKKIYPVLLIILFSFFWGDIFITKENVSGFYFTLSRVWQILLGAVVGLIPFFKNITLTFKNFTAGLGALFIIAPVFSYSAYMEYPSALALFPTLGTGLIILSGPHSMINKLLSNRMFVFIGLLSFPLYLWHWPLLSFASIINLGKVNFEIKLVLLSIAFILSVITYSYIEKPVRHSKNKKLSIYMLTLAGLVGAFGYLTFESRGFEDRTVMKEYLENNKILKWNKDLPSQKRCQSIISYASELNYCQISQIGKPTVAIVGDSHAQHFYPGLQEYLKKKGENLLLLGIGGCPGFIDQRGRDSCEKLSLKIINTILKTSSIHTVIFANMGAGYLQSTSYLTRNKKELSNESFFAKINFTLRMFEKSGKKIFYVLNIPSMDFDPKVCIKQRPYSFAKAQACFISRKKHDQDAKRYKDTIYQLTRLHSAEVIDPSLKLCDQSVCIAKKDRNLIYRDPQHLTYFGSIFVAPIFANFFQKKGARKQAPLNSILAE